MKLVDNIQTRLLAKALDVYSLRQKITASNISNIDTPGYKKLSVSFEEELNRVSRDNLTGEKLDQVSPEIKESDQKPIIEQEMMEMADNQMRVQLVTRALRHNFQQLRSGITGRNS